MRPGEHEENEHTLPLPKKFHVILIFSFGCVHSIPRTYQTNDDFDAGNQERILEFSLAVGLSIYSPGGISLHIIR